MKRIIIRSVFIVLFIISIVWTTIESLQFIPWIWIAVITISGMALSFIIFTIERKKEFLMILLNVIPFTIIVLFILYRFILHRNTMRPIFLPFFGGYFLGMAVARLRKEINKQKQSAS